MCTTSKDVQKSYIMQEMYKTSFGVFLPYHTQAILYLAKYVGSAFFRLCLLCFFVVAAVGLRHAICYCAAGYPWKYICKPVQNAVLDELCHGKQNDRERGIQGVGREKGREIDLPWDSMVKFPQIHFGLHFPFENLAVRVACPLQGTAQPSQEIIYH